MNIVLMQKPSVRQMCIKALPRVVHITNSQTILLLNGDRNGLS